MKRKLLELLLSLIGRENAYRIGRAIYMFARKDVNNDISNNGELMIQTRVVQAAMNAGREELNVFDIGANVGDWSLPLLSYCDAQHPTKLALYLFEPVPSTLEILRQKVGFRQNVRIEEVALSSSVGFSPMHIIGSGAGTNSLHSQPEKSKSDIIKIKTTTVYQFCSEHKIDNVYLMKCDTEGHDAEVIIGALPLLREGRIAVLQFEYNFRWVFSRHYLKDVFDAIEGLQYKVGKICRDHIEIYPSWHFELDKFFESNYVLIRKDALCWFDVRECHFDKFNAPTVET
jgi:FkbM family methyltransferase